MKPFIYTLIIIFSCLFSLKTHSQIAFEKGYFIDQFNNKTECYIKNNDWMNNPTHFSYKLSINDKDNTNATIESIKEFGIYNCFKYIRANIKIDRSTENTANLSDNANPDFKDETLFLKVLIEGQASLLNYTEGNITRFFYKLFNSEIKQLVYKKYAVNDKIYTNSAFKKELQDYLNCKNITHIDIINTNYNQKDLEHFFIKYNECVNSPYIKHESIEKKDMFNLNLRIAPDYRRLEIHNYLTNFYSNYDTKPGFRLGIEAEVILPFNKNKWSLTIEPTFYNRYKAQKNRVTEAYSETILSEKVNLFKFDIPISIRHYLFLNEKSKIFANASIIYESYSNSKIDLYKYDHFYPYTKYTRTLDIRDKTSVAFGTGYKYNKFSFEIRYIPKNNILSKYTFNSNYNNIVSFIFGYKIL